MILDQYGNPLPEQFPRPPGVRPSVREEPGDRVDYDTGRELTPEKVDRIMLAANRGDTADQCRLAHEILEKNADIMQALSTRKEAVTGCGWHLEPGDDSADAKRAAEALEKSLRECGDGEEADTFDDLLEDLLGALLPGFAVSEILWRPGGEIAGFHHIAQRHFTFVDSYSPRLITRDCPQGVELDRRRIIYHKLRFHGGDAARGGLIRPLAWLHCFRSIGEKDLLSFIERHGMPFIAAMVDPSAFDREKNLVKRLIRNFGSSGGGIFTKNVELKILDSVSNGDAYFRLLEYLEAAVNKVILGQTASSGDGGGLSKDNAQSAVRQDILESDCRILQRVIDSQLLKPWTRYNFGTVAAPKLVIDCVPPEDKEKNANTLKTLFEAGFEADAQEVSERFGWNLARRTDGNGQIGQTGPKTADAESAKTLNLKQKYDAMGVAIRAGLLTATPEIEAQTRAELGLPAMTDEVKKAWAATGGIRQPITLKTAEEAAVSEALDVDDRAASALPVPMGAERRKPDPLEQWLEPIQREVEALSGENVGEDEFKKRLTALASGAGFGGSEDFEQMIETVICAGIAAGYEKNRKRLKK